MTATSEQKAKEAEEPQDDAALKRSRFLRAARSHLRNAGGLEENLDLVVAGAFGAETDRLAPFGAAILAIRWATIITCLALSYDAFSAGETATVAWAGVLLAYTAVRTLSPITYTGKTLSLVAVLGETALFTIAVIATGYWVSPLVISLVAPIMLAGFARGYGFAFRVGLVSVLSIGIPDALRPEFDLEFDGPTTLQWSVILLSVSVIAGYGRRISGEADRQRSLALDRLGRLADANALLYSLHRVAQTLPASLDYEEVLDSTVQRLRGLIEFDAVAVLVQDETDGSWIVARRDGVRLPERLTASDLTPILEAVTKRRQLMVQNQLVPGSPGLAPSMGSGVYAPLVARGSLIGMIALEHKDDRHFTQRDVELVNGFVEPVALAIDNARWFARLRTVGADEERTRIARELHDRIGQSLAYLAFELDRIISSNGKGGDISPSLNQLREDVRGVIGEVRDTLYDLRTDVTEAQDMASTLEQFVDRLRERTGLEVNIYADRGARLPILQERELWRIAQEALTNVERHAEASRVRVLWRCNGKAAALEVADDGSGFPVGTAGRLDSYGIMGMRERAASIGATLDVLSAPGKGTRVRCYLAHT